MVALEYEIFGRDRVLTEELATLAARIRAENPDQASRMMAALRFVQNEIRYVHISKGTGGYIPNSLAEITARRYGDCKDKTVLLLALLRALDIEAYPVLANTEDQDRLQERLPSQTVFDHVFVTALLDGQRYWLDGTMTHQKGDIANLHQPDYGTVLVLKPGNDALEEMEVPLGTLPGREITETYDLSAGAEGESRLKVETLFRGEEAENIRAWIAADGLKDVQESYLEYYGDYYPGITLAEPYRIEEDSAANSLRLTEHYVLPGIWTKGEDDGKETWIYLPEIRNSLNAPGDLSKSIPYRLDFPNSISVHSTIQLPEADWEPEQITETVDNPYFHLKFQKRQVGNRMERRVSYRTKGSHVPGDQLADFSADIQKAKELVRSQYFWYGGDLLTPGRLGAAAAAGDLDGELLYGWIPFFILACLWMFFQQGYPARLFHGRPDDEKQLARIHSPIVKQSHWFNQPMEEVWACLTRLDPGHMQSDIRMIVENHPSGGGTGADAAPSPWSSPVEGRKNAFSSVPVTDGELKAGIKLHSRKQMLFGLTESSCVMEISELIPGRRLVLHTPMQTLTNIGPAPDVRCSSDLTFDLEGKDGMACLTVSLALTREIPIGRAIRNLPNLYRSRRYLKRLLKRMEHSLNQAQRRAA